LADLTKPLDGLYADVARKAMERMKWEGGGMPIATATESVEEQVMAKFAYYLCFKCQTPYFGGNHACAAAAQAVDPSELVCAE
jgi:hypothetical protein